MKKQLLYLFFLLITANTISAQITNTFPLDDSVGIGTTSPTELFQVNGNIKIASTITAGFPVGGDIVFGAYSLTSNISGIYNSAFGNNVLHFNLSGSYNCGFGTQALANNISGSYNSAFGMDALLNNVGGEWNTAMGLSALSQNQIGSYNLGIGAQTMALNIKGSYNTAVGNDALYGNKKGNNNVAVGWQAMNTNQNGNNNTAIGNDADVTAATFTNASAFGNGALVDASNKVRIGNASISSNGGQVSWTAYSDARIKTDVKENVPGLEFINLLKPVTYHFDVDKQNEIMGVNSQEKVEGMYDIEKITFTGFLAQDVETAAKKINYDFSGLDKSGEIMGLRYAEFVVPLVKAVQELSTENQSIKAENENFESRITQLEKLISKQGIVLNDATTEEIYKQSATIENETGVATLSQNVPNPFTGNTSIAYFVPETAQQAHIKIANANGVSLFMAEVRLGNGVLEVDATQLAAGTYSYTLIVDSKVVDTKLMVIL
jgi:trimeric autotransporter adhesin